ncbi:dehydrogenase [Steroidobacter denitrificans]|uniref:Dehydrogenase n=1 Tax=Steroidobacter denitrificans TaxID=465721 RepID=A0A127F901_STEDE|nr:bi-domain-containing oxidoreductase [Steroidobacter denitrificans]AMN46913.1 dehydrogenase [Steroidobacter denitrificans]
MQQILQKLDTGEIGTCEVPAPAISPGKVLIRTHATVVSAGTERMLVKFGQANLLQKARQQPDKVREVLAKMHTDGVLTTLDTVRAKLDEPLALGYCNVGSIQQVGAGVDGLSIGDRVVSNGKHAQIVCVPKNLCTRVPDSVADDHAAFTVPAAIGLQGIRLAAPTIGECVVVTGLGLIGLLCVQLLRAHGCRVLGVDFDPHRLELARKFGADAVDLSRGEDPVRTAVAFSRGRGIDAVIITASTRSSEPVSQAAAMCRKRGRIVLVGVTGLELSRADFYEKELSFQVSCSYGPGRYDPEYEEHGRDYPVGFVRWTQQRNFEAVLDLMASGTLNLEPMISHRFALEQASEAYRSLEDPRALGIVLQYISGTPQPDTLPRSIVLSGSPDGLHSRAGQPAIAFIGAGAYAGRVLIPAFKAAGAQLHTIVSATGVSAAHYGRKYGFMQASTDAAQVIGDAAADAIAVVTRHDSHARYVLSALRAGKHVFVEKPLCLTLPELSEIEREAAARPAQLLMVGFNRRFSPHVRRMKELLESIAEPKTFVVTVNAGHIPPEHWTQDRRVGGGRIIGEACHYVDLLRCLSGHPIAAVAALATGRSGSCAVPDTALLALTFADGSVGTIHYVSSGHKSFPKERVEVFCARRVLQLDNFRVLKGWGWGKGVGMRLWRQDKGARAAVFQFIRELRCGGTAPTPLHELIEVTAASIRLTEALHAGSKSAMQSATGKDTATVSLNDLLRSSCTSSELSSDA